MTHSLTDTQALLPIPEYLKDESKATSDVAPRFHSHGLAVLTQGQEKKGPINPGQ